jgi:hypothetical protein
VNHLHQFQLKTTPNDNESKHQHLKRVAWKPLLCQQQLEESERNTFIRVNHLHHIVFEMVSKPLFWTTFPHLSIIGGSISLNQISMDD